MLFNYNFIIPMNFSINLEWLLYLEIHKYIFLGLKKGTAYAIIIEQKKQAGNGKSKKFNESSESDFKRERRKSLHHSRNRLATM